jgi:O-antigen ligase
MRTKQELAILKEVGRIYQNCPERVATYTRWRWIATIIAWLLIFVAFLLSSSKMLNGTLCLVIALLGGFAGGLSLLFAASAKQMPLLVRYTALRDEEIQKRLEELKDA